MTGYGGQGVGRGREAGMMDMLGRMREAAFGNAPSVLDTMMAYSKRQQEFPNTQEGVAARLNDPMMRQLGGAIASNFGMAGPIKAAKYARLGSMDEIRQALQAAMDAGEQPFVRYSSSIDKDMKRGFSNNYSTKTRESGLSALTIDKDTLGDDIALRKFLGSYDHFGPNGYLVTGKRVGTGGDNEPTIEIGKVLGLIDRQKMGPVLKRGVVELDELDRQNAYLQAQRDKDPLMKDYYERELAAYPQRKAEIMRRWSMPEDPRGSR